MTPAIRMQYLANHNGKMSPSTINIVGCDDSDILIRCLYYVLVNSY